MKRIVLIGNPNVGKSAVFSRLTGIHATTSNYPGTTVSYKAGVARIQDQQFELIDTPGAYSLEHSNEAEKVAADLVDSADIVVNVVDATNLERNLLLTMELLAKGMPLILCLNMYDDAEHKGISIDVQKLADRLRIPVVPTVGVSGFGISTLAEVMAFFSEQVDAGVEFPSIRHHSQDEMWEDLGRIIGDVQSLEHRHHTFLERVEDISVHPYSGIPFAVGVLALAFFLIRTVGEGLIRYVLDPFFEGVYLPLMQRLSDALADWPLVHHMLIGRLSAGDIDLVESMGLLTTALYVPLGMVLPYILSFYFVLSLLEDIGYLPRLGVMLDAVMHRIGMHGFSVIPILLGLGCNVPGILATRSLETKRQRYIACTLISIGVPCVSLQAMIFKLLGDYGLAAVVGVYAFLALVVVILGRLMRQLVRGYLPEMIIEIPPYRLPRAGVTFRKLFYRTRGFIAEAVPLILIGIALLNLLDAIGVFQIVAWATSPLVTHVWGLPSEAILPIIMGFLRKDIAAGMLMPLNLTVSQLMTACVLLSLTFPCVATFVVLFTELGWRDTLKSIGVMLSTAVVFGGIANFLFRVLV
jgi:ferrous iron transport protein B